MQWLAELCVRRPVLASVLSLVILVVGRVFYTQLLPELRARRKLVVAITHDDAYFHCADRLVRLEGGRIAADGPPPGRVPVTPGHSGAGSR